MRLISTITDKEIFGENIRPSKDYSIRSAARAILFDRENRIALLHSKKLNFHKLPGGGIEKGENIKKALEREILEEIGCEAKIDKEIGKIIEVKNKYSQKQTSYCFIGRIVEKKVNSFTQEEKDLEMEIIWVAIKRAIKLLENDSPDDYTAKFIVARDLTLLRAAQLI